MISKQYKSSRIDVMAFVPEYSPDLFRNQMFLFGTVAKKMNLDLGIGASYVSVRVLRDETVLHAI